MSRYHRARAMIAITGLAGALLTAGRADCAQSINANYAGQLTLQSTSATVPGHPAQMAWGPDGRL